MLMCLYVYLLREAKFSTKWWSRKVSNLYFYHTTAYFSPLNRLMLVFIR